MTPTPAPPPDAPLSFLSRFRGDPTPPASAGRVPPSDDRRRFPRQHCRSLYALCQERLREPDELRSGQVRDLSPEGLGLVLSRPYAPGTEIAVELQDQAGWVKGTVRVRVVHARHDPGAQWFMGCHVLAAADAGD